MPAAEGASAEPEACATIRACLSNDLDTAGALAALWSRYRLVRYPLGLALVLSAGVVIAVGGTRATRYLSDTDGFLEHETEHFRAIQWMNSHLNPSTDRVATNLIALYKALGGGWERGSENLSPRMDTHVKP